VNVTVCGLGRLRAHAREIGRALQLGDLGVQGVQGDAELDPLDQVVRYGVEGLVELGELGQHLDVRRVDLTPR